MNRPRFNFNAQGAKAKDSRKTLRTLLRYLQPYRAKIIVVMIFAALSGGVQPVSPARLAGLSLAPPAGIGKVLKRRVRRLRDAFRR